MIDYGLLATLFLAFAVPSLFARWWPLESFLPGVRYVDAILGPTTVGLIVGRLTFLFFDDPESVARLSNVLVVRSGVEFWPGVGGATVALAVSARRKGAPAVVRIAAITPLAMVGYASYEAACLVRDGCYGPPSPVGLRPEGLSTSMLPVGLAVAASVVGGAFAVRGLQRRGVVPVRITLLAVGVIALVRSIGSFWLPTIGGGLSRQHLTSIGVAAMTVIGLLAVTARGHVVDADPSLASSKTRPR